MKVSRVQTVKIHLECMIYQHSGTLPEGLPRVAQGSPESGQCKGSLHS